MPDLVYLSLWLRAFTEEAMLPCWARVLEEFPRSSLAPGIRSLTVYPFEWGETPVLEESFREGADVEHVLALAAEFLHEDYAYEAQLHWDVWVPGSSGALDQWERVPQIVSVACVGPRFESDAPEDRGDLQFNFGLDSIFLPEGEFESYEEEIRSGVAGSCYRENVAQFLQYIYRLQEKLPIERKLLWSGSGEDLGEQIRAAWRL
jgi:hypothetical protein